MSQTDPIQAQLIAARKNQILDAAAKVFAEKGFSRATIKEVARTAGIADGTIYNYFENKEALLIGVMDRLNESDRRAADMAEMVDATDDSFMRAYIARRLDAFQPYMTEVFQVVLSELLVNKDLRETYNRTVIQPTYAAAEPYFRALAERGEIDAENLDVTMRLMPATILGLMILTILGDETLQQKYDQLPDLLTQFFQHGIRKEDRP